jgi:hypothetical protein
VRKIMDVELAQIAEKVEVRLPYFTCDLECRRGHKTDHDLRTGTGRVPMLWLQSTAVVADAAHKEWVQYGCGDLW